MDVYRRLYNMYSSYPDCDFKFLGIHAAAYFGLESCVNKLRSDNCNSPDIKDSTARRSFTQQP